MPGRRTGKLSHATGQACALLLLLFAQFGPLADFCHCEAAAVEASAHACCDATPAPCAGADAPTVEGPAALDSSCCSHHQPRALLVTAAFGETKQPRSGRPSAPITAFPLGDPAPCIDVALDAVTAQALSTRAPVYLRTLRLRI